MLSNSSATIDRTELPQATHSRRLLQFLNKLWIATVLLFLFAADCISSAVADSDILYVGNVATNTVRRFKAETGSPIDGGSASGVFVQSGSGGLSGPRGIIIVSGKLFVINQNVDLLKAGEILRYRLGDGAPDDALVPFTDDDAPFAPRGIVSRRGVVYVANFTTSDEPPETLRREACLRLTNAGAVAS